MWDRDLVSHESYTQEHEHDNVMEILTHDRSACTQMSFIMCFTAQQWERMMKAFGLMEVMEQQDIQGKSCLLGSVIAMPWQTSTGICKLKMHI